MKIVTGILVAVVILLSVVGCTSPSEPKPFPPPQGYQSWEAYYEAYEDQTGSPQPTPAYVSEPAIPNYFTTYTDETGLFSVSYPGDWELGLSRLESREQSAKDIIKAIDANAPVERQNVIFLAGLPTEKGSSPNVNIVVESLPGVMWTLDEVVDAYMGATKEFIQDCNELSRVNTTINGREATVIDYEGTFPGLIKLHYLIAVTLVGKTAWVVTCSALPGEFSQWQSDLNAIVSSLRIMK